MPTISQAIKLPAGWDDKTQVVTLNSGQLMAINPEHGAMRYNNKAKTWEALMFEPLPEKAYNG